jgi:hypothetical protein
MPGVTIMLFMIENKILVLLLPGEEVIVVLEK